MLSKSLTKCVHPHSLHTALLHNRKDTKGTREAKKEENIFQKIHGQTNLGLCAPSHPPARDSISVRGWRSHNVGVGASPAVYVCPHWHGLGAEAAHSAELLATAASIGALSSTGGSGRALLPIRDANRPERRCVCVYGVGSLNMGWVFHLHPQGWYSHWNKAAQVLCLLGRFLQVLFTPRCWFISFQSIFMLSG